MIFTPFNFFFLFFFSWSLRAGVYEYSSRNEAPQRGLVQRLLALAGRVT